MLRKGPDQSRRAIAVCRTKNIHAHITPEQKAHLLAQFDLSKANSKIYLYVYTYPPSMNFKTVLMCKSLNNIYVTHVFMIELDKFYVCLYYK